MRERIKALNELLDQMLAGIDRHNDHLLYQTDQFVNMKEQLERLKKEAEHEPDNVILEEGQGDYEIIEVDRKLNRKMLESDRKEAQRADKLSLFLQYVEETKKAIDEMGEEPATVYRDIKAIEYMLKLKMVIAEMQDRIETENFDGDFSDAIDVKQMKKIYRMDAEGVFSLFRQSQAVAAVKILKSENTSEEIKNRKHAIRQAVKNGTLQQYSPVIASHTNQGKVRYDMDKCVSPVDVVKVLSQSERVKNVLDQYRNAEKYWYGSALTEEEERASRRAFMECYAADLGGLYEALNVAASPNPEKTQSQILEILKENGLDGMMRDYHDMMKDRKVQDEVAQADSDQKANQKANQNEEVDVEQNLNINNEIERAAQRERGIAPKDVRSYLYDAQMTDEEKAFRAHKTTSVLYDAEKNAGNNVNKKEQLLGLKEFHKWIYRNCDETDLGEFFGANGSARAYMEDFMKAPYDQQIQTLYMLENKTRRNKELPSKEALADYVPNIKKLKDVMVSSKFKFWQRLNGKKHRWNKIKECMDRVAEKQPSADKKSALDHVNNDMGVVRSVLGTGDYVAKNTLGNTVAGKAGGFVNSIYRTAHGIVKLFKSIRAWRKRDSEAEASEKANMIADITSAGLDTTVGISGGVDFVQRAADGTLLDPNAASTIAGQVALQTGMAFNTIAAARAGIKLSAAQYRNFKYGTLDDIVGDKEQIEALPKDSEKQKLIEKLKKHQHAISGINHRKVLNNAMDMVGSSALVGSSIASGAWGLMASSAALSSAFTGAGIIAAPLIAMAKNKYEIYGYRRTIDSELYADDAQKDKEVGKLKTLIDRRLKRIPATAKNKSIREDLESLKKSESSLLHRIRTNVARKQKCVNEKQLRNKMVAGIAGDLYDMHLQAPELSGTAEKNELNRIQREGADRLIKQAGANIDTDHKNKEELQSDKVRQKNVDKIVKGLM